MSNNFEFTGLIDLADLDTTDVKGQVRRLQPEGIYLVTWEEAELRAGEGKDGNPYVLCNFVGTCHEYVPLDDGVDVEAMQQRVVGNRFFMSRFLNTDDLLSELALLKGQMYDKVGIDTSGRVGGVPDSEPGWVDRAVGRLVAVQVKHRDGRDGVTRDYYSWLAPSALEKHGITDWDSLRQTFETDENYDSDEEDENQSKAS